MARLYDLFNKTDNNGLPNIHIRLGFSHPQGATWNPPSPAVLRAPRNDPEFRVPLVQYHSSAHRDRLVLGIGDILGVGDWVAEVAPHQGMMFCGLDRSMDPYRLAGIRLDMQGVAPNDHLKKAWLEAFNNGGAPNVLVLPDRFSPRQKYIEDEWRTLAQGVRIGSPDSWHVCCEPYEGDPFVLQDDTFKIVRNWDKAARDFVSGNLICEAPGYNLRMLNSRF